MKRTAKQTELIATLENGSITKQQQDLLFKILNGEHNETRQLIKSALDKSLEDFGVQLEQSHIEQGKQWLLNQWKTPNGKERKNNPFGYREQDALDNLRTIELAGYYDCGRSRSYYIPMYDVLTKDGYGFQYYVEGGEIQIIG